MGSDWVPRYFRFFDLIFDFAMVGLVLGGVLEIFKILLPRLGSYRVSRFFRFFIFSFLIFDFLIFDF